MPTTATATDEPFRPDWADCIVLQCTRCRNRKRVPWELFSEEARVVYEPGDMPERIIAYPCHGHRGACGRSEVHFVDLDASLLRASRAVGAATERASRVCGCRECKVGRPR